MTCFPTLMPSPPSLKASLLAFHMGKVSRMMSLAVPREKRGTEEKISFIHLTSILPPSPCALASRPPSSSLNGPSSLCFLLHICFPSQHRPTAVGNKTLIDVSLLNTRLVLHSEVCKAAQRCWPLLQTQRPGSLDKVLAE